MILRYATGTNVMACLVGAHGKTGSYLFKRFQPCSITHLSCNTVWSEYVLHLMWATLIV